MKKNLCRSNCVLLVLDGLLYICFSVYTVLGSYPLGNFITPDDTELQFIIILVYQFLFLFISKCISLKLKVDLSFRGAEIFTFVPKAVRVFGVVLSAILIIYSGIVKIHFTFSLMTAISVFSILLEFGITKMFRAAK